MSDTIINFKNMSGTNLEDAYNTVWNEILSNHNFCYADQLARRDDVMSEFIDLKMAYNLLEYLVTKGLDITTQMTVDEMQAFAQADPVELLYDLLEDNDINNAVRLAYLNYTYETTNANYQVLTDKILAWAQANL